MLYSSLQVRAGSRALYRPLSASVLSRPEIKTEVRKMQPLQLLYITAWTFLTFPYFENSISHASYYCLEPRFRIVYTVVNT